MFQVVALKPYKRALTLMPRADVEDILSLRPSGSRTCGSGWSRLAGCPA
jgi:hypothetical protein